MADLYETAVSTAHYLSLDPIKNLKIRVCLSRISAIHIVPQAEIEDELAAHGTPMNDINALVQDRNFGGAQDNETVDIRWQQKYFCQREVDQYKDPVQCVNVLEKKYHDDITKMLSEEKGRKNKRVFTYVEHDNYANTNETMKTYTTNPNEDKTLLAQKMSQMRFRKNVKNKKSNLAVVPKANLIDYNPSEELKKQNHFINPAAQTMYVMVDCTKTGEEPTPEDEVVICTIKMDANGGLSIKPDFSKKGQKAYRVESGGLQGREMFEYTIENISTELTKEEQARESKMYKELYSRHQEFLAACVGYEFDMPPKDEERIVVVFSIDSAVDFEYDDLFVTFVVRIPENGDWWSPNHPSPYSGEAPAPGQLFGVTQRCRTKQKDGKQIAYFSCPFNFELRYNSKRYVKEQEEAFTQRPEIIFEVSSLDSWTRKRVEGYGYMYIPTKAGDYKEVVHTWRPESRTSISKLRRFFTGGSPELDDLFYASTPDDVQGSRLSKFGFVSITSGSLNISMEVLCQSQAFLESHASQKKIGHLMNRIGGLPGPGRNIMNILDAFKTAKMKMMDARDNLKAQYVETLKAQTDSDD